MDLSLAQRLIFPQFQCVILQLRIETGRFEGKTEAEWLYFLWQKLCCIENPFQIQCPLYTDHRHIRYGDIMSPH